MEVAYNTHLELSTGSKTKCVFIKLNHEAIKRNL